MNPKWIVFAVTTWIVLAVLGGVIEQQYLGVTEAGTLSVLMNVPLFTESSIFAKITGTFFDGAFWNALLTMFLFDFAFFTGGWALFKWIFFLPISIAMAIGFISVARGVPSG